MLYYLLQSILSHFDDIPRRSWQSPIGGDKVGKSISLPNGSGCVFFALVVTPRRFPALEPADREVSVLPSTLISGIRRHGSGISDSYDSF